MVLPKELWHVACLQWIFVAQRVAISQHLQLTAFSITRPLPIDACIFK